VSLQFCFHPLCCCSISQSRVSIRWHPNSDTCAELGHCICPSHRKKATSKGSKGNTFGPFYLFAFFQSFSRTFSVRAGKARKPAEPRQESELPLAELHNGNPPSPGVVHAFDEDESKVPSGDDRRRQQNVRAIACLLLLALRSTSL
jgi:hypothetical protein